MATIEELEAENATLKADLAAKAARIKEVNDEAKGHRLNADNFRTQADEHKTAAERARAEAEAKIAEANAKAAETMTKAQERAVTADLKVAAREAGAVDISDALKLLDRSKLKINDDGDVENAAELLAELKKAKPYLFGDAKTSSTAEPPRPKAGDGKKATEMTKEEYAAARAAMLGRR
ncbi:MAG TPA: phage scaffolding protein [Acidocella sp.]|nr:phage scaffolding protein [Acidocella sp.]